MLWVSAPAPDETPLELILAILFLRWCSARIEHAA